MKQTLLNSDLKGDFICSMAMSPWARFQSCNLAWDCLEVGKKVLGQIPGAQSRKGTSFLVLYTMLGAQDAARQNISQMKAVNTCQ